MPHCEGFLYKSFLGDILENTDISELLLLGNDLSTYRDLEPVLGRFACSRVSACPFSLRDDVFNDCFIQLLKRKVF